MLAAVRWRAVLIGLGVGILASAGMALLFWLVLSAADLPQPVLASTALGTVSGFGVAGWVAGRGAPFSPWFHGALAALAVSLVVVVISVRSGSRPPTTSTLVLAVMAIVLGGIAGAIGGRSPTASTGVPE